MTSARRTDPTTLAAVAAGGALGAPARYGVAQVIHAAPHGFPWPTFWTNVSGCFALGALLVVLARRRPRSRYLRPFLATGFLGAYTTCSTFAVEADLLVRDRRVAVALAYTGASVVAGLVATWAGMVLARRRLASPAAP